MAADDDVIWVIECSRDGGLRWTQETSTTDENVARDMLERYDCGARRVLAPYGYRLVRFVREVAADKG